MTYKIWVKCPKCGREQRSLLTKTHKCVFCGHTFVLFPKRKRSRIVKVEGNFQEYLKDVQIFLNNKG